MTTWKIDKLHNWEHNPRAIKKDDFERLKRQIQELGLYKPFLVEPDGNTLGGNMRLRACKELGITDVPVSIITPKNDAERVKYALSDNDRAGYYVEDELAELIAKYQDEIDLSLYKVDLKEPIDLKTLLDQYQPTEEDEAPPLPEGEPISKLGEVYQLGRHRLMCGDATKIEDVERLMDGKKADMVFTDPPYGINMQRSGSIDNDDLKGEDLESFISTTIENISVFNKGGVYICCGFRLYPFVSKEAKKIWDEQNCVVWVKPSIGLGGNSGNYRFKHEFIWFGNGKVENQTDSDVWEFNRDYSQKHPTVKPIELVARAIKNSSKTEDIVLDLFGGSGSTLIAAEQTNRTCYMMELDERYCDVIQTRYNNFVTKTAK